MYDKAIKVTQIDSFLRGFKLKMDLYVFKYKQWTILKLLLLLIIFTQQFKPKS